MSTQNMQYEKTGKRMAHYCDLEGQDSITVTMSSMAHPLYLSGWIYQVPVSIWI